MKKLYIVSIFMLACTFAFGQDSILVRYTGSAPEIDGVEEDLWLGVDPVPIEQNFGEEEPTVTAYWKAMWGDGAIYVLVSVEDDDHYPAWESGGSWFEYDQPEIYFDVNTVLADGLGASDAQGHYQVQPHFEENGYGTPKESTEVNDFRPACYYCYTLTDENYVWEYEIQFSAFTDIDFTVMDKDAFLSREKIGFDVTIIDQDENVTDNRQRAVWSNTGNTDENYVNMDDAGAIVFVESPAVGIQPVEDEIFRIYPNPAVKMIHLNLGCDMVQISNLMGQVVMSKEITSKWVNLESLNEGIYFLKAYRNGMPVGTSKILKK